MSSSSVLDFKRRRCLDESVVLLVGCLTSQQQASVSQGRICSDNFTCCHTEIDVADPDESGSPSPTFRRGGGEVLGGGWVGWDDKKEEKKGKLRQRKRRKTCSPENVI